MWQAAKRMVPEAI